MFDCPNCKEALGDDIQICPFCRHEITDHERVLIEKARREEARNASAEESSRASEFSSLRLLWQMVTVAIAVLTIIVFNILLFADFVMAALVVLIAGLTLLVIENVYFQVFKKANSCPHCGGYLFRSHGTMCQWCGGKIR